MEKKENTPQRTARRKYEEVNKEKRKQTSGNFGTMIPRPLFEEINAFLKTSGFTKVQLIAAGYEKLKEIAAGADAKKEGLSAKTDFIGLEDVEKKKPNT